jgi:branched-chain amino acid transport system ATP-binding protein
MSSPAAILEVKGLRKTFGGVQAVADVNLEVPRGQIHAVIGPNGAGKSTLFNLISGYYRSDGGSVVFKGEEITRYRPQKIVKMGMGRSFQVTKIFPRLTVFENVQTAALLSAGHGFSFFSRSSKLLVHQTDEILSMVRLGHRSREMSGVLSAGDRKRLELGITLAASPDLLLLDEPTCGMSPQETNETIELIKKISAEKALTVLFTEHKMDMVFGIASYIMVMNFGKSIAAGTPTEIRTNLKVQEVYFGSGNDASRSE